ncbi:MAG: type II toxin-antitoxin system prevent-host-death family antitoxin [Thermoanaerobaculia bacterium]|nr:type II toxin-antitoxin system prevent-host-death family antitoxin [Thermoanaerobaculia bacterium]
MVPLEAFSVRDLRQRSGDLLREAEEGRLSVITKHGKPTILAVPFDEKLLSLGLHRALALHLVETRRVSLGQAARLAGMPLIDFMEWVGQAGVAVIDYPAEDLEAEVARAL